MFKFGQRVVVQMPTPDIQTDLDWNVGVYEYYEPREGVIADGPINPRGDKRYLVRFDDERPYTAWLCRAAWIKEVGGPW